MLIELGDFSVTLQRKRVKNINLRISRTGEVQLSAPVRTPIDVINNFLQDKRSWIEAHRYRLQKLEPDVMQNLMSGAVIHFQGKRYALQLYEIHTKPHIELSDTQLHLFVKPSSSEAKKQQLLLNWYRTQMQQCLPSLFDKWQTIIGVSATQVSIKRMKSRWGSCHPIKKHITLNLRLIEKPVICLEYVIVHELVHLLEASHNKRFHALMSHYLPEWKEIKKQLSFIN